MNLLDINFTKSLLGQFCCRIAFQKEYLQQLALNVNVYSLAKLSDYQLKKD